MYEQITDIAENNARNYEQEKAKRLS